MAGVKNMELESSKARPTSPTLILHFPRGGDETLSTYSKSRFIFGGCVSSDLAFTKSTLNRASRLVDVVPKIERSIG